MSFQDEMKQMFLQVAAGKVEPQEWKKWWDSNKEKPDSQKPSLVPVRGAFPAGFSIGNFSMGEGWDPRGVWPGIPPISAWREPCPYGIVPGLSVCSGLPLAWLFLRKMA